MFLLNPAETLKKARDAQRISDLKAVKTALGIMLTASSTPSLDSGGAMCSTNTVGTIQTPKIAYSSLAAVVGASTVSGSDINGVAFNTAAYVSATQGKVDGSGWIPVNLKALTGGTPISSFPLDPVNTVAGTATTTDLVYRYACQNLSLTSKPSFVFELNARLESSAYTVEDNKMSKDGGDNDNYYEAGNSLNILPTSTGPQF